MIWVLAGLLGSLALAAVLCLMISRRPKTSCFVPDCSRTPDVTYWKAGHPLSGTRACEGHAADLARKARVV